MTYKFTINGTLPSLNDHINELRKNKFCGAKHKKEVEDYISIFIKKQLRGIVINEIVTVHFSWYEPNKKRDVDNIAFAKKFIFDALVKCGVLKSDGWACVAGFSDTFHIDKNNPRVVVEIKEECYDNEH